MEVAMPHMGRGRGDGHATVHVIEQAGAAGFLIKGIDTQPSIDHLLAFHASRGAGNGADS